MFTEEDAENDGKIKNELKGTLKGLANREGGEIYEYYLQVLDDYGISPGDDLADHLIRVLEDDVLAERIRDTEVSLRQAKISQARLEDVEKLMELQEKFSDDGAEGKLEQVMARQIESKINAGNPLVNQQPTDNNPGNTNRELKQMVKQQQRQIDKLTEKLSESGSSNDGNSGVEVEDFTEGDNFTSSEEVENVFDDGKGDSGSSSLEQQDGGTENVEGENNGQG